MSLEFTQWAVITLGPNQAELLERSLNLAENILGPHVAEVKKEAMQAESDLDNVTITTRLFQTTLDYLASSINEFGVVLEDEILQFEHLSVLCDTLEALKFSEDTERSEELHFIVVEANSPLEAFGELVEAMTSTKAEAVLEIIHDVPESFIVRLLKVLKDQTETREALEASEESEQGAVMSDGSWSPALIKHVPEDSAVYRFYHSHRPKQFDLKSYLTVLGDDIAGMAKPIEQAASLILLAELSTLERSLYKALILQYSELIIGDTSISINITHKVNALLEELSNEQV